MSPTTLLHSDVCTVAIYRLRDPRTGEARYVGKATDPERRLQQHLEPGKLLGSTYKERWLRGLIADGLKPELEIVEWVEPQHANEAERVHIFMGRELGWPLTNGTNGGDGGAITDPDALARIRAAHLGVKRSDETKAKMSASAKERCADPAERERLRSISNGTPPVIKGEANNQSYLSDEQVREIRERNYRGETGRALAREFGTTPQTVSFLVTGKFRLEAGGPIRAPRPRATRSINKENPACR